MGDCGWGWELVVGAGSARGECGGWGDEAFLLGGRQGEYTWWRSWRGRVGGSSGAGGLVGWEGAFAVRDCTGGTVGHQVGVWG